jgi:hypothetical protein
MPKEDHSSTRSHQSLPQGGVELSLDELAKGLATGTLSRGKAIRWMGGALLGAALASFPGVAWANDCRRLGRECRRDSQCCSRNCVRRGDDKVCGCPEGKTRCKYRCVNLQTNERHCGSCGNRCDEGEQCVRGECTPTCGANGATCTEGTQCCSGNCVNAPTGTCACKTYSSDCTKNSECCSGYCNQFGICDQNVVECACQDGFMKPGLCTMAACGDTTALNQLCNSFCLSAGRGSGVAGGCFQGCGI